MSAQKTTTCTLLTPAPDAKLWSYATRDYVNSSPAVANGVVYVGSVDHKVYALNARTGARLWPFTSPVVRWIPRLPWRMGWCMSARGITRIYALDAETGAKLWSFATGSPVLSSPAVANGVVYVAPALRQRQRVRAECSHRRQAVELRDRCRSNRPLLWRME